MNDYKYDFQTDVEKQICKVHKMSPLIAVIDGQIRMKCCCLDFKIKCYKIIIESLSMYKKDYPGKRLRVVHKNDADNDKII